MIDAEYWNQRYLDNNTPWDMNQISPPLKAYFDQLDNKDLKILIPGFGKGHELIYLEDLGFHNVTGIEMSESTINNLKSHLQHTRLLQGDFFDFDDNYDLIIEQTFFCALDPHYRQAYVKKMTEILKKDAKLVGVLFNRTFDGGPPFGGDMIEYRNLFANDFILKTLEPCKNSYPGRIEVFINFIKK